MTLARLLRLEDPQRLPPPTATVILDEAGMATTDDIAALVDRAHHHDWRLVFVGDPAQLPAVGRGGMFAHWTTTLPHHELTDPRRFDNEWEARASLLLRAGDPRAIDAYDHHDRLHASHPALIPRVVAREHERHVAACRTVAITTNSTATARAINTEIQRARPRRRPVALADGTALGVGDQIATRRNDPHLITDLGQHVRNRHTWTVTAINRHGSVTVHHPDRGEVELPTDYIGQHVELGWAVTGYGNQGDTVDIGLAVLEPGTTRNHAYVALTRGRTDNTAWLPDDTGLANPADGLETILSRGTDHESALATRMRLYEQIGLDAPDLLPPLRHGVSRAGPHREQPQIEPPALSR
jgi:ATP-dependent exoDNAse (exonuclease V) alpha subunit